MRMFLSRRRCPDVHCGWFFGLPEKGLIKGLGKRIQIDCQLVLNVTYVFITTQVSFAKAADMITYVVLKNIFLICCHEIFIDISQFNYIQDPVSNIQKTGLTNNSSFLVWSGLEKGFNYECDHYGAVNNHFPVYWAIFGMMTTEQTNNQTTG